ncbi:DUF4224 domain-containing protein [Collimonas fungivorans]|uniref:DUF4224 domain-containing protein n=1 Tax=Collimonas fungivorans TaxID=158899 RepID=UPI00059F31C5|nr:DUF4224 domain-containing protein [Collimonas fungivorans]
MTMFLEADEIAHLTGRKMKSKQIEALREMAIPFYVNAVGSPVVVRAILEGRSKSEAPQPAWIPRLLREKQ